MPEIIALVVLLAAAGVVVGYLSGLLGVGGGGLLVPVLYETFGVVGVDDGVRTHLALGTSLAVILPTSVQAYRLHRARGAADAAVLGFVGLGVVAGVGIGLAIAARVDGTALRTVFVVFCAVMAARLLAGNERWQLGSVLPGRAWQIGLGIVTGLLGALIGIGGGAFVTSFMTLHGRPMLQAIATAAGIAPVIAVPGVVGYVAVGLGNEALPPGSLGFVSFLGVALLVPTSLLATGYGVRAAHRFSRRALELCFAAFLIAVGTRFLFSLF